jgi:NAD(P)-dependent dehydrogenase (short-subunit alcohol dehydrogenase family)
MDLRLDGKRALIMGSSSGMGRAIAVALAAEGTRVFVTGRDSGKLAESVAACGAVGSLALDMTSDGAAERLVAAAVDSLGGLDIVVGNSGGGKPGGLVGKGMDDVRDGFDKMLAPQLGVILAAIPSLQQSTSGRIIVLTARSVLEATPELALSSVFRSGVAAAARSLAMELAPNVTVNVVVPGQFDTGALARFEASVAATGSMSTEEVRAEHVEAIPAGRLGEAEEIADLVTFLASPKASYITGATVRVDGGLTRGF